MLLVSEELCGRNGTANFIGQNGNMPTAKEGKFHIGLAQFACSLNPDENLAKLLSLSARPRAKGRRSSACRSCSARSTSAARKCARCSTWPSRFPGPTTERFGKVAHESTVSWSSRRCSSGARRAFTTTRPRSSTPTAQLLGHLPQDAHPRRSALLREVLLHAGRSRLPQLRHAHSAASATLVCWDQWYPEGARLTALQGADVLFYPTAIGWHPAEKAQYGAAQLDAWQTIQRAHAIANGVYVAAVNRVGHEGAAGRADSSSGAASFVADPFGQVIARSLRTTRKRCWSSSAIRSASRRCAATGRSCATAASTPTAPHHSTTVGSTMPGRRAALGFRMPAEWEPHAATWLAWPHERERLAGQVRRPSPGSTARSCATWPRRARPHPGRTTPRRRTRAARRC